MSWKLVGKTTTGWKRYKDENGNDCFQRPNGRFANKHQYNGAKAHGKEFSVQDKRRKQRPRSGTVKTGPDWKTEEIEPGNYDSIFRFSIREYRMPIEAYVKNVFQSRLQALREKSNQIQNRFDVVSWGLTYTIIDNVGETESRRITAQSKPTDNSLKPAFMKVVDDLMQLLDSYKAVEVNETILLAKKFDR